MSDLISALQDAYPGITYLLPGDDCIIMDDGAGPYIKHWNRAEPKPNEADVLAQFGNGSTVRQKLKYSVTEERKRRETQGVLYLFPDGINGTIQTRDAEDFRNINGQCSAALILQLQGITDPVLWFYDAENVQHFMTPAQMLDMGIAVQAYVAALVDRSRIYKNSIDDPATDLSTIDPINGW